MSAIRLRQRCLLQWVLVALLAAALAPTLSRALNSWRGHLAPWSEACAVMPAAAGDLSSAGTLAHLLDHCPMCSLQHDGPGTLPVGDTPYLVATLSAGPPISFYQAPRTSHAWSAAHARGPPSAS